MPSYIFTIFRGPASWCAYDFKEHRSRLFGFTATYLFRPLLNTDAAERSKRQNSCIHFAEPQSTQAPYLDSEVKQWEVTRLQIKLFIQALAN